MKPNGTRLQASDPALIPTGFRTARGNKTAAPSVRNAHAKRVAPEQPHASAKRQRTNARDVAASRPAKLQAAKDPPGSVRLRREHSLLLLTHKSAGIVFPEHLDIAAETPRSVTVLVPAYETAKKAKTKVHPHAEAFHASVGVPNAPASAAAAATAAAAPASSASLGPVPSAADPETPVGAPTVRQLVPLELTLKKRNAGAWALTGAASLMDKWDVAYGDRMLLSFLPNGRLVLHKVDSALPLQHAAMALPQAPAGCDASRPSPPQVSPQPRGFVEEPTAASRHGTASVPYSLGRPQQVQRLPNTAAVQSAHSAAVQHALGIAAAQSVINAALAASRQAQQAPGAATAQTVYNAAPAGSQQAQQAPGVAAAQAVINAALAQYTLAQAMALMGCQPSAVSLQQGQRPVLAGAAVANGAAACAGISGSTASGLAQGGGAACGGAAALDMPATISPLGRIVTGTGSSAPTRLGLLAPGTALTIGVHVPTALPQLRCSPPQRTKPPPQMAPQEQAVHPPTALQLPEMPGTALGGIANSTPATGSGKNKEATPGPEGVKAESAPTLSVRHARAVMAPGPLSPRFLCPQSRYLRPQAQLAADTGGVLQPPNANRAPAAPQTFVTGVKVAQPQPCGPTPTMVASCGSREPAQQGVQEQAQSHRSAHHHRWPQLEHSQQHEHKEPCGWNTIAPATTQAVAYASSGFPGRHGTPFAASVKAEPTSPVALAPGPVATEMAMSDAAPSTALFVSGAPMATQLGPDGDAADDWDDNGFEGLELTWLGPDSQPPQGGSQAVGLQFPGVEAGPPQGAGGEAGSRCQRLQTGGGWDSWSLQSQAGADAMEWVQQQVGPGYPGLAAEAVAGGRARDGFGGGGQGSQGGGANFDLLLQWSGSLGSQTFQDYGL